MKALLFSLTIIFASVFAQAYTEIYTQEPQVTYLSWCQNNQVVTQNGQGQVYALANCSEQNLVCKETQSYKHAVAFVAASCETK